MKSIYSFVVACSVVSVSFSMETPQLELAKPNKQDNVIRRSPSEELQSITEDLERGWREDITLRIEGIRSKMDAHSTHSNNQLYKLKVAVLCFGAGNLAVSTIWALSSGLK